MISFRIEKDSIGEMKIPESADYGIHTARAVENFPIAAFCHVNGVVILSVSSLAGRLTLGERLLPLPGLLLQIPPLSGKLA